MKKQQHLEFKQYLYNLKLEPLKFCNTYAHFLYSINNPKIEKRNLFKILLERHDWFHEYSDDYGSYKKGKEEEAELFRMMKDNQELTKLYKLIDCRTPNITRLRG